MASFIIALFSFYIIGYLIKTFSKINIIDNLNYNLIAPSCVNYGESREPLLINKQKKQKLLVKLSKDKPLLGILKKKKPIIKINLKGNFSHIVQLT